MCETQQHVRHKAQEVQEPYKARTLAKSFFSEVLCQINFIYGALSEINCYLRPKSSFLPWCRQRKICNRRKAKPGHRKLLRKWFWSYLELKTECSERLKRAFFSFLQIFEWRSWNRSLGKWGKAFKTI